MALCSHNCQKAGIFFLHTGVETSTSHEGAPYVNLKRGKTHQYRMSNLRGIPSPRNTGLVYFTLSSTHLWGKKITNGLDPGSMLGPRIRVVSGRALGRTPLQRENSGLINNFWDILGLLWILFPLWIPSLLGTDSHLLFLLRPRRAGRLPGGPWRKKWLKGIISSEDVSFPKVLQN